MSTIYIFISEVHQPAVPISVGCAAALMMPPRTVCAFVLALTLSALVPVSTTRHLTGDEQVERDSFGWRKHVASGVGDVDLDGPCTVDRVDVRDFPTLHDFHERHRANGGLPVVVTGLFEGNGEFRTMCGKDALLRQWGDHPIVLSTANTHSYEKKTKSLSDYVEQHVSRPQDIATPGNETLYWFGDNDHKAWSTHFEKYHLPPLIPKDADVALSFGVGGPNSGVPLHVHGPGFSETVIGRKRWWLAPPKPKPRFNPNATALEWALNEKNKETNSNSNPINFLACTVSAGEAIYFPDGWWHLTLNLDDSVFMSSFVNYNWEQEEAKDTHVDLDDLFEL